MMASIDIDDSFAKVPHTQLLRALFYYNLNCSLVRYVFVWLMSRKFRLTLLSSKGQFASKWGAISRGTLSPFL